MKKNTSFVYYVIPFFICAIVTVVIIVHLISFQRLSVTYEQSISQESNSIMQNPFRGFYKINGYMLSDKTNKKELTKQIKQNCKANSYPLVLLEINLKNYANTDISSSAQQQLDTILTQYTSAKKQIILRFLYDWDGKALQSEPSDFFRIKNHIQQLSSTINKYKNCIYIIQGAFIGNVGEMNNSNYNDIDQIRQLIETLAESTDPQIYLAVRTPAQLRGILRTRTPLSSQDSESGNLASRLGLYNDGMLGNVYDMGTYDDTPITSSSSMDEPGTREEELLYQYKLCQYVPNGGEVAIDNEYNDLENAVTDLAQMHVSYLNSEHEEDVLNKWKKSTYTGDDVFSGCTGYDYVEAHLGYRYFIQESHLDFHSIVGDDATLYLTIANSGFSSAYKKYDTTLLITNQDTGKTKRLETTIDNRRISGNDQVTFKISPDIRSLKKGTYTLSLEMKDSYTEDCIHFANAGSEDSDSVSVGTLTIQ